MEVSLMTTAVYPLMQALAQVPDHRKSRGKRHPLPAILALACGATLCGCRSLAAIAQWGHDHADRILGPLGFRQARTPCVATFHRVLRHLDVAALEQVLTRWFETWTTRGGGLALDGKFLRGSHQDEHDPVQLLAAFSHTLGITLAQRAVSARDEVEAAIALLDELDLQGWVVTGDAGLTQRHLTDTVLERGGDYVWVVKGNQGMLYEDIAILFAESASVADTITATHQVNLHGGRIECRSLQTSSILVGYSHWPGLAQVFQLERRVSDKKTGVTMREVRFGVTSLSVEQADAARLLKLVREHWRIENQLHWVRDVTFAEDRSRVRSGHAPQVLASLRNVALSLLRMAGCRNIAAGLRRLAGHADEALRFICEPPSQLLSPKMK
jgi:predicted transposase YbfD/YdcC